MFLSLPKDWSYSVSGLAAIAKEGKDGILSGLKERGQRMRLESEAKAAKPKVEYFDSFITAEDCTNIRTTAKEIQLPERQFVAWLLKNKYLYRTAKGYLMPYAKKSNEGLFIVKDFYYGYGQIAHHTLITPNGKLLFMRLASRIRESA